MTNPEPDTSSPSTIALIVTTPAARSLYTRCGSKSVPEVTATGVMSSGCVTASTIAAAASLSLSSNSPRASSRAKPAIAPTRPATNARRRGASRRTRLRIASERRRAAATRSSG
jgi:hypothetical protein